METSVPVYSCRDIYFHMLVEQQYIESYEELDASLEFLIRALPSAIKYQACSKQQELEPRHLRCC